MGDPVKKRGWIFGDEEHAAAETEAAPVVESVYQRALKRQYGGEEAKPEVVESVMTVGAPEVIKGPTKADDFELSSETDKRAAEMAPSNVENKPAEQPWYKSLLGALGEQEERKNASEHGGASRADASMQGAMLGGLVRGATSHVIDPAKEEQAANPGTTRVAELAGGFANPLNVIGKAGVLGSSIGAGVQGAVRSLADAPEEQPYSDRAVNALVEAGKSFGLAGAVGLGAKGVGAIGTKLGAGADKARIKAWDVGDKDLAQRAARQTARAEVDMASYAAENGGAAPYIHPTSSDAAGAALVRAGERMVPPNTLLAKSPKNWAAGFGKAKAGLDDDIASQIDTARSAGAQLPVDPRGTVARNLYNAADDAMVAGRGEQRRLGSALSKEAEAVQTGPQFEDPHAVRSQKAAYDAETYDGPPGEAASYQAKAGAAAGNQYRDMLRNYIGQTGPAAAAQFQDANDAFGVAATLGKSTAAASNKAAASGGLLVPAIGAGVGAMLGGATGGLYGAGAGLLTGGAMGYGARKSGPAAWDMGANVARAGQGVGEAVGDLAKTGSAPNAAAQLRSMLSGPPQPPTSNDSHGEIERAGQSQGQNLGKNIERALATNPQVFGPYLSQFQEVKGDPDRLTALAERLSLDTKDPHFKRTVWPLLTGATR